MKKKTVNGALVTAMLLFVSIGSFIVLYMAKDARRSRHIPEFSLASHTGETITRKDIEGKVVVAQFFFTGCETLCPEISEEVAKIQSRYMGVDSFLILTHTLDPLNDSIPALIAYAENYNAIDGRWYFLRTDSASEMFKLANAGYYVSAKPQATAHKGIAHGTKLVLLDKSGTVRGYYDATKPKKMKRLMEDIQGLLEEPRSE